MKVLNKHVVINSSSTTKKQLFKELATIGKKINVVSNAKTLEKGFWDREGEGSTGMEFGFAIPHAKIDDIKEPTILIVKTKEHIKDYETFDNSKVKNIIALLIPRKDFNEAHIKILSSVAVKLTDAKVRKSIINAKTISAITKIMENVNFDTLPSMKTSQIKHTLNIVGITSCAAGVAHTFIAAENLIKAGKKLNYNVRIETQGASGPEAILTYNEIMSADLVIIASDIDVNTSRFQGKKFYRTNVAKAVKNAKEVIEKAIIHGQILEDEGNLNNVSHASDEESKRSFLSHIMTGVSWMIPLLIAAAIMLAIPNIAGAIAGQSDIISQGNWDDWVKIGLDSPWWRFMNLMLHMGWTTISLMFPIFAAFTAMSIGNKPAFIPGLVGGFLAKPSLLYGTFSNVFTDNVYPYLNMTSGFWGALIIGILMGYTIKYSNKYIKVHKTIGAIKPMLFLPFIGAVVSIVLMVLVINPVFGLLNEQLIKLGQVSGEAGKYVLALVIAPMTASDLGGPINKAAFAGMLQFYESKTVSLTMRVIPTITPSIGLGLAAMSDRFFVKRRVFDDDVRPAAPNAILLAMLGISEGGLPFLFKRPLLTMPINMLGGLIGAYVGILIHTEQWFPDSAIWAWPFAKPIYGLLLGIIAGTLSTMFMHIYFRTLLIKLGKITIEAKPVEPLKFKWRKNV